MEIPMRITVHPVLRAVSALSVATLIGIGFAPPLKQACAAETQFSFSEDILPLLKWRCSSCHQPGGEGYLKSGVDLTTYEGVMKGTKYGPMVIPGDPETSNLMMLLDWRVSPEIRMPHGKRKLSICDRDSIRDWISQGAKNN
jgi:hypothetical protein